MSAQKRCKCGRAVGFTETSGRELCWWCDPAVPAEMKALARSEGGRAPKAGVRYLPANTEPFDFTEPAKRIDFRAWIAWLAGRGELSKEPADVMLRAVDGAAEDHERHELYPRVRKLLRVIDGKRG
jgi:hypothetical protein